MKLKSSTLFRPSTLAIVGAVASAVVWSLPAAGSLRTGYDVRSEVTLTGTILIVAWYATIFMFMKLGEITGRHGSPGSGASLRLESSALLAAFSLLAGTGLLLTYAKILLTVSPLEAVVLLTTGFGNDLKESLYEEYSAGVVSLRYLIVFSAPLAVLRYVDRRKIDGWIVVNAVMLILSVVLSSRLMFVASALIAGFLWAQRHLYIRLRAKVALKWSAVIFLILATLNYSRNSNYYAESDLYFWSAGLSSIVTYVGSPFQVLVGVAGNVGNLIDRGPESYRNFVDISETLNTNSAFVQLHETFGYAAWPYMACTSFLAGFVFMRCYRAGRTALLLPCGAILYAAAELWRLDLFRQGIFIVWLTMGLAVPFTIGLGQRLFKPFTRATVQ